MSHLDEATLVALRDGEAGDESAAAERHLTSCSTCRGALEAIQARRDRLAAVLESLDERFDPADARRAVRSRMRFGAPPASRFAHWSLRRVAAIVLLLGAAGAAYALPGSPLRSWLSTGASRTDPAVAPTTQTTPALTSGAETGVHLHVTDGPVRIVLKGVAAGTLIEVRLVDGTTASVTAPRGTRFTTSDGRIEATTAPGTVRVELPRGAHPSYVEVSGQLYLRNSDAGLDVPGPVTGRSDGSIRFTVPAR